MQEDFEKGEFEKNWQKAFENSEITPWRSNWGAVKQELDNINKVEKRKKSLMLWRYAAVACLLISIGLYSSGWLNTSKKEVSILKTGSKKEIKNIDAYVTEKFSSNDEAINKNLKGNDLPTKKEINDKNKNIDSKLNNSSNLSEQQMLFINKNKSRNVNSISYQKYALEQKKGLSEMMDENLTSKPSHKVGSINVTKEVINENINFLSAKLLLKNSTKEFTGKLIVLPKKVNYLAINDDETIKEKDKKDVKRWNIDLAFAPGGSQPNIQSNKATSFANSSQSFQTNKHGYFASNSSFQNAANSVDNDFSNAKPALSYQVNLGAGYMLNSRFSVNVGLQYLYQNSQINTSQYSKDNFSINKTIYLTDVISTNGSSNQLAALDYSTLTNAATRINSNSDITLNNTYRYMSLPIIVRYKIINKKIGLSAGTGVSADILINNQIGNSKENVNQETFNSNNSIYKSLAYSGLLNVRLDYKLSKRYSFFLEPGFRTALNSFTKYSNVSSYPISLNVGTGFFFQF